MKNLKIFHPTPSASAHYSFCQKPNTRKLIRKLMPSKINNTGMSSSSVMRGIALNFNFELNVTAFLNAFNLIVMCKYRSTTPQCLILRVYGTHLFLIVSSPSSNQLQTQTKEDRAALTQFFDEVSEIIFLCYDKDSIFYV